MILSGKEIVKHMGKEIVIEPFDKSRVNPNSYNLSLYNELMVYDSKELDMAKPNSASVIKIPEDGFVLQPNVLYLGRTNEYTKTENYIPMLEGRSSVGRLGVFIHVTAGFGDVGFAGYWTLEIFASNRFVFIRMWKYARSIIMILTENMTRIRAESINIITEFNRPCYGRTL